MRKMEQLLAAPPQADIMALLTVGTIFRNNHIYGCCEI